MGRFIYPRDTVKTLLVHHANFLSSITPGFFTVAWFCIFHPSVLIFSFNTGNYNKNMFFTFHIFHVLTTEPGLSEAKKFAWWVLHPVVMQSIPQNTIPYIGTEILYETCFGHNSTQKAPKSMILVRFCSILPLYSCASIKTRFKAFLKKWLPWIRRCFLFEMCC